MSVADGAGDPPRAVTPAPATPIGRVSLPVTVSLLATTPDKGGLKSALAAERSASKKASADLAVAQARIKELEDASKSEEQRQQEAAERLQSEHSQLTRDLADRDALIERYRVAAAKG